MDLAEIKDPKLRERIRKQIAAEDYASGIQANANRKSGDPHVTLATYQGEAINAVCSFARVTLRCFRCRSLDDDNAFPKYFVDACKYAGALFDDSKEWAKIEVIEHIVEHRSEERVQIEIEYGRG